LRRTPGVLLRYSLDVIDDALNDAERVLMPSSHIPYRVTKLDDWAAVVEGDVDGDGSKGRVFEIKGGTELRDLPDPYREEMLGAVAHFGGSLATSLESDSRNVEERATLAAEVFEVLLQADAQQFNALVGALKESVSTEDSPGEDEYSEEEMRKAEDRARLKMKAIFLRTIDESFTVAELREEFKLSRQRLKQLRDEERLFAVEVPYERSLLYPTWQFDEAGRPREAVRPLIHAAKEAGLDALGFHLLMTGEREDGPTGLQYLRDGQEDLALALVSTVDR
jgi:hypothetical protein